ncbi:hypothetical protein ACFYZ2_19095 [Streptomyces sviceus]|uniref:hypothetical protein n=1 Tax=Streptomyces sviceus TaxID=285530 RepID=UPI0036A08560
MIASDMASARVEGRRHAARGGVRERAAGTDVFAYVRAEGIAVCSLAAYTDGTKVQLWAGQVRPRG